MILRPLAFIAAVVATVLPVAAVSAQAVIAPKPAVGATPAFALPAAEEYRLANGMRVTLLPYGQVPKVSVALSLRAGGIDEGKQVWLSQLAAQMLKEGAGVRNAAAMADAAAGMGGQLAIAPGELQTMVSLGVLSEHGVDAVGLLADVARRPTLPTGEFDRVRQDLVRAAALARSRPGPVAQALLLEGYYGDSVYGRSLPAAGQLEAYSLADVKRYLAGNVAPNRAHLYIAGRFDRAAVRGAVERAFGDWAKGAERMLPPRPAPPRPRLILFDRPGAPQTTIVVGLAAPATGSTDDISMRVMDALLAGSFTSRITQNIREDKGYTYSPRSQFRRHFGETLWGFNAEVTTRHTGASLREIFREVRRLQSETPGLEEARGMSNWLAGTFILNNGSTDGLVNSLVVRDLHSLPGDWLTRFVPAVLAVEAPALRAMAGRHLPLDRMTLVLVGDVKTITSQLAEVPDLKGFKAEIATAP